jgi:hypothetical protein
MADLALDTFGELDLSYDSLTFFTGADAVAQHLKIRLRLIRGEWFLDTRVGIPYYSQIWVKNPNLGAVHTTFRRAIITTPGVERLERIDSSFDASTREYRLDFTAKLEGDDIARNFSEVFVL